MEENPILVTGIHRSGSTFVGKMLSLDKHIAYLEEPFNTCDGLEVVDVLFKYLNEDNVTSEYEKAICNLLKLKGVKYKLTPLLDEENNKIINKNDIIKQMFSSLSFSNFFTGLGKLIFRSKNQLKYRKHQINPLINRVLLKDPLACFSSEFLHHHFDVDVIVLLRHPLNFIGSIKRLNWTFDFNNFLNQPKLMNDYLKEYEDEIREFSQKKINIVKQGSLLWLCIYKVLFDYIDNNPEFIVVKHENICSNPIKVFRELYSKLDIDFTKKIKGEILKHTSGENSVEVKDNKPHYDLKRNSSKLIWSWKKRLNSKEVDYIRNKTYCLSNKYYSKNS